MNCMNCGNILSGEVKFCPKCGSPVSRPAVYTPPEYTPPPAQMQTSWDTGPQSPQPPRRKSRVGKILLILFALLLVGVAGAGVAVYYGYRYVESSLKSSEAYRMAEAELKRSSAVRERLGEIKETGFPVGSYKVDADGTGSANYTMSVQGTKGSGRYFVSMEREAGTWRILRAFVNVEDGEVISVVGPSAGSVGEGATVGDEGATDDAVLADGNTSAAGRGVVSGGVLNGKAVSKPQPVYPAIAKSARASGTVVVSVVVDEGGKVTKAQAVSGHPLLRAAAEAAARQARFSPTLLSGRPVKVSGVITYVFKLE